jgi:hypothetical protein
MKINYSQNNTTIFWTFDLPTHWGTPVELTQDKDSGEFSVHTSAGGVNGGVTAEDIACNMLCAWDEIRKIIKTHRKENKNAE